MQYNGVEINSENLRKLKILTFVVTNNQTVFDWQRHLHPTDIGKLYANNILLFTRVWGKENFCMNLSGGTQHIWVRQQDEELFLVFTGKKGTSYELLTSNSLDEFSSDKETGRKIIHFLLEVLQQK